LRSKTGWLAAPLDSIWRGIDRRFEIGDRVELPEVLIEVIELTSDGRPAAISCHFARVLENASFFWLYWSEGRYRPWRPPGVRESVDLATARVSL
jgi:hypothetical protein